METWDSLEGPFRDAAGFLVERLGRPRLGVVLGSGFLPLAGALGLPGCRIPLQDVPGLLAPCVDGHDATVESHFAGEDRIWVFRGRLHLYEGYTVPRLLQTVRTLAYAGAGSILLTCAAGGLVEDLSPGAWTVVEDHLNLTGTDPLLAIPSSRRQPPFLDLQGVYDRTLVAAWRRAAEAHGVALPGSVLAAVAGPCYETPAEVRMLRRLGAHVVTMSTVHEAIAAHYLGLHVAAIACVANPGAGLSRAPLRHADVVASVTAAAASGSVFLRSGIEEMLATERK